MSGGRWELRCWGVNCWWSWGGGGPSSPSLSPPKGAELHGWVLGDILGTSLLLAVPLPTPKPPKQHPRVHQHPRAQQAVGHVWGHRAVTPRSPAASQAVSPPMARQWFFWAHNYVFNCFEIKAPCPRHSPGGTQVSGACWAPVTQRGSMVTWGSSPINSQGDTRHSVLLPAGTAQPGHHVLSPVLGSPRPLPLHLGCFGAE